MHYFPESYEVGASFLLNLNLTKQMQKFFKLSKSHGCQGLEEFKLKCGEQS